MWSTHRALFASVHTLVPMGSFQALVAANGRPVPGAYDASAVAGPVATSGAAAARGAVAAARASSRTRARPGRRRARNTKTPQVANVRGESLDTCGLRHLT